MHPPPARRTGALLAFVFIALWTACDSTEPDRTPAEVTVTAIDTLRSIGATATLTAVVRNKSQEVLSGIPVTAWESSDPAVLTVTNTGLATALTNGAATITARVGTLSGSTPVIVRQRVSAVTISGSNVIGSLGSSVQLAAAAADAGSTPISGRTVVWSSSNTAIASIDAMSGIATATGPGAVTLHATVDGTVGNHSLNVVQVPASIAFAAPTDTLRALGATGQFAAVVKDSGGSTIAAPTLQWTSSNPSVVTVHGTQGLATAIANGAVFVRALAAPKLDSIPLAVRQRISPAKSFVTVARPLLFVDDVVRITLQGRDSLDQPLSFGGSTVVFSSTGSAVGSSAGAFASTVDRGDGTYTSDFTGTAMGSPRVINAMIGGTPVATPQPTLRVVGFTKVAVYSAGFSMSCGTLTTAALYCWGEPNGGARGTGVLNADPGPTVVSGGHQWTDFDVGPAGVCGIASAKLYCWGDAGVGSLGNGATGGRYPLPVLVLADSSFLTVDLGLSNGDCAITLGHTAMCWSSGTWGRLGNGADTMVAVPVAVSGGHKFSAIATSFAGTCGVTDAGAAMCWGIHSVLGISAAPPDVCTVETPCAKTPVTATGGIVFKPIIAHGANEVCAIATNDKTYCWGLFDWTPTELFGAPVFTGITQGDLDACGVAQSGTVYCWGTNRNGRFGSPPNPNEIHRVPEPVPGDHVFTQLSMSQNHMCGVTTDGNAWCWGSNGRGELGDGTTTPSATPVRVRLFGP